MKKIIIPLLCLMLILAGCSNAASDDRKVTEPAKTEEQSSAEDEKQDAEEKAEVKTDSEQEESDQEGSEIKKKLQDAAKDKQEETAEEEEEGELNESPGADRDLFADFLRGTGSAFVSDNILWEVSMMEKKLNRGAELTASELAEFLQENGFYEDVDYKLSYAPLTVDSDLAYALCYEFDGQPEIYTVFFVFTEKKGDLEIVFAADQWSRRSISINEYGIINDSGSGGAGSHYYGTYALDKNGIYQVVSDLDEEYYGFGFYDENGKAIQDINDIMHDAGEYNDKAKDIVYYREKIDGEIYYYFLGVGKLTQDTVNYIDGVASDYDFKFDGKATADEARKAYEEELGISDVVDSTKEPYWKTLE